MIKAIDRKILIHLKEIQKSIISVYPQLCLEDLIENWQEKELFFDQLIEKNQMQVCSKMDKESKSAVLLLSYSGSILAIGPLSEGKERQVFYNSLQIRPDYPDRLIEEHLILKDSIEIGHRVFFEGGSLKQSSSVFKMALLERKGINENLQALEQTSFTLANKFKTINRKLLSD